MAASQIDKDIQVQQQIEMLESKIAFQDDVIEQLNQEITVHQTQIAQLRDDLMLITKRLKDVAPSNIGKAEDEPPPPHY